MQYNKFSTKDVKRHYFTLPNEIFSLKLTSGEIAVYTFLLYLENRKTYQCYPSYKTIGAAVDMSQNTVRKYVQGLERRGLITTEPTTVTTKDGKKRNGNLLYTIRPIREVRDRFHICQSAVQGVM